MYDHGTTIVRGLRLTEVLDTRRNEVWRAVPEQHGTGPEADAGAVALAVKLLHPAYEPVLPGRIGPRARALSRVVRSGTRWVQPLDHGYTTDGRRYVASPLHRGSLADQLEHGPTPWYPAATLIAGAASTVAEAHAAGHSFGHLRPSGILVDGPTDVGVVAYGMSTRRFDDGTAQFMAPEVDGEGGRPIPPSDVFSLVLILASLIAGRPIDRGEASREVLDELSGSAPARILEIIDYGLSTGVRNRHADAGRLAHTLETALRDQDGSGRRLPPSDDTVDPLSALLAEPLVTEPHIRSPEEPGHRSGAPVPVSDLEDSTRPDETPTTVPFDLPVVKLDDPTDPGMAAVRELDTETDHFGRLAHLDRRIKPGSDSVSGPLADLLTELDSGPEHDRPTVRTTLPTPENGAEPPVDRRGDDAEQAPDADGPQVGPAVPAPTRTTPVDQPTLGSIIDVEDHRDEPSRMVVVADDVGHFVALHRRRLASSLTIIGVTGAIGAALLIGVGDLLRQDVTTTGGTPVSSSIVEQVTTIERSSPLNDQAPLENARSLLYEDIPTTLPVRRATAPPPTTADETTTTIGEATVGESESSTTATTEGRPSSTVDGPNPSTETTSKGRKTTTTSTPPATEATTTTAPPTTTTEATTSTTKRRGRPGRP